MDTDSFELGVNTNSIIKNLKNPEDLFDLNNLNSNHEFFSNKTKNVIGKFERETPENNWIDESICIRSTDYSFKREDT